MPGRGVRALLRTLPGAVAVYLALSALHVFGDRAVLDRAHPTPAAWVLAKLALPAVISALAIAVAARAGRARGVLGLGAARARFWIVAGVAGLAPVMVVLFHGATQGFASLAGVGAARLALRIAVDQAWLEELLARGLLLSLLLVRVGSPRRAAWLDAACFGAMHLLQFLWPPITVAGVANGLVLVVIALPTGYALARLTIASGSVLPAMGLHFLLDLTILPQKLMHANVPAILAASAFAVGVVLLAPPVRRAAPAPRVHA